MTPQDSTDESNTLEVDGTVPTTCTDCEIVIYDVSYSDGNGGGYLNPKYCPMCGGEL